MDNLKATAINFGVTMSAHLDRQGKGAKKAMGKALNISSAAIYNYCNGKTPPLDTALRISRYLGFRLDDISSPDICYVRPWDKLSPEQQAPVEEECKMADSLACAKKIEDTILAYFEIADGKDNDNLLERMLDMYFHSRIRLCSGALPQKAEIDGVIEMYKDSVKATNGMLEALLLLLLKNSDSEEAQQAYNRHYRTRFEDVDTHVEYRSRFEPDRATMLRNLSKK